MGEEPEESLSEEDSASDGSDTGGVSSETGFLRRSFRTASSGVSDEGTSLFSQDPDDLRAYKLNGTPEQEPAMHPHAIRAVLGAASIASESRHRLHFLRLFSETPLRRGSRRYYDNCLWFFCLLMLTGHYRIYI